MNYEKDQQMKRKNEEVKGVETYVTPPTKRVLLRTGEIINECGT